jgi:hypothetical protein
MSAMIIAVKKSWYELVDGDFVKDPESRDIMLLPELRLSDAALKGGVTGFGGQHRWEACARLRVQRSKDVASAEHTLERARKKLEKAKTESNIDRQRAVVHEAEALHQTATKRFNEVCYWMVQVLDFGIQFALFSFKTNSHLLQKQTKFTTRSASSIMASSGAGAPATNDSPFIAKGTLSASVSSSKVSPKGYARIWLRHRADGSRHTRPSIGTGLRWPRYAAAEQATSPSTTARRRVCSRCAWPKTSPTGPAPSASVRAG